jgi:hypothetical protein
MARFVLAPLALPAGGRVANALARVACQATSPSTLATLARAMPAAHVGPFVAPPSNAPTALSAPPAAPAEMTQHGAAAAGEAHASYMLVSHSVGSAAEFARNAELCRAKGWQKGGSGGGPKCRHSLQRRRIRRG